MYMPMFMLKTQYIFPSNTHEIWEIRPIFHAFYAHNHSNFMHSSCPVHTCSWHELDMNKGFNPIFHAHESFSHAHEVMPLLHAHKPLLRDQKHEQSLFMGIN